MNHRDQAFSALYRRLGRVLYARCLRILKDPAAAEDAVQEVFLRVWTRASEVPPGDPTWAWTLRVASNYCLNVLRDASGRQALVFAEEQAPAPDPEAAIADRLAFERALDTCPDTLRRPAVLCYGEGQHHDQIAAHLGVTRRTVINRLNAFKRRVAVKLERAV